MTKFLINILINIFLILLLFSLYSCETKKFITIFEIDQSTGIFIPLSFQYKSVKEDSKTIVERLCKVNVKNVEVKNDKIEISLQSIPNIKYDYDSYLLYSSLYLSFFNSFLVKNVDFLYNQETVILAGIEYKMDYNDYYKYPINDIFSIGDVRKGKYYLFSYTSYYIPVLMSDYYDLNKYFQNSVEEIKKRNRDLSIETFDKLLKKKENIDLVSFDKDKVVLKTNNFFKFVNLLFNKSNLYFLFYSSDINVLKIKQKFLWMDLEFNVLRPKNLYLNLYPINPQ